MSLWSPKLLWTGFLVLGLSACTPLDSQQDNPTGTITRSIKCGPLTAVGCCNQTVRIYCVNGNVTMADCTGSPKCGWSSSQGKYTCGTSGGSDPSGKNPFSCEKLHADGGPPPPVDQGQPPAGCFKLTGTGCCHNDTSLDYCENGLIKVNNCAGNLKCGWNSSQSKYTCGTSGGSSPDPKLPKACSAYLPDGGPPPLPDLALTDTWPHPDKQPPSADMPPPPADAPQPPVDAPQPSLDAPPPPADMGPPGDGPGCGGIPPQGCCRDANSVDFCENNQFKTEDCIGNPKCGWNATKGRYSCGVASGAADPSGKYPKSCQKYMPDGGPPSGDGQPADMPPPPPPGCFQLTEKGCCQPDGTLDVCENNKIKTVNCSGNPKCGWNSSLQKYSCGTTGGASPDPKLPVSCNSYMPDGGPSIPDMPPPPADMPPPPADMPKPPQDMPPPPADMPRPPADMPRPPADMPRPPADMPKPPPDMPQPPTDTAKTDQPKPPDAKTDGKKEGDIKVLDKGKQEGGSDEAGSNKEGGAREGGAREGGVKEGGAREGGAREGGVKEGGAKEAGGGSGDGEDDGGCNCSTAGAAQPPWRVMLLGLLGLLLIRRRRR